MLTKQQENALEIVQKKCLRCIFGYNKSYDELLAESELEPLKVRRSAAFLKFARKASDNPIYARWFKKNQNLTTLRNPKTYEEKFARTNRLYNSPLYACLLYTSPSPRD